MPAWLAAATILATVLDGRLCVARVRRRRRAAVSLRHGLFLGALALAGGAIVDDAIVARERPRPAPRARVSWAPGLVITPNVGVVSLGGAF